MFKRVLHELSAPNKTATASGTAHVSRQYDNGGEDGES